MRHILFGLLLGHRYRRQLGKIVQTSPSCSICDVDPAALYARGFRAIVFDFDGVLGAHGALHPQHGAQKVLVASLQHFKDRVFLLSNKPTPAREAWFAQHYPGLVFVRDVRKKPYPDGLGKICQLSGVAPQQVVLLDDRLLTGGVASLLAGTGFVYINQPTVDYACSPFKERIFSGLRRFEQFLSHLAT